MTGFMKSFEKIEAGKSDAGRSCTGLRSCLSILWHFFQLKHRNMQYFHFAPETGFDDVHAFVQMPEGNRIHTAR